MFVFNLNLNSKKLFKTVLVLSLLIAISLFLLAGFKIVTELLNEKNYNNFEIPSPEIAEITPENYTNILKEVHDDIDTYVGQKISFTGYIYRLSDLKENQFILARDMKIHNSNQTVVVGFLSEYDDIKNLKDNTWIKVTGEIKKGYYYGDIPYLEISELEIVNKPENPIVSEPDETYVQTAIIY